jgi:hypothetical protein
MAETGVGQGGRTFLKKNLPDQQGLYSEEVFLPDLTKILRIS